MILSGELPQAIAAAVERLRAGALIGLPTETVYGLAADAENDAAARLIFSTKGRPADHPLIVHVTGAAEIGRFAADLPVFARRLVVAFWPGPLTLILPRRPGVAAAAAGGNATLALRCPSHPVAQRLLAACAAQGIHGLAAPSANRFGKMSPTTAQHVEAEFGPDLLTLDGGPCTVGIESTIIDCTRGVPVLLRPGQLARSAIERAAGERVRARDELDTPSPKASGTLAAHYAPRAHVRLLDARELAAALRQPEAGAGKLAVWARSALAEAPPHGLLRRMPDDAVTAARELFAVLHEFDAWGAAAIWVESPPAGDAWDGVRDRLLRAAASA
ncbi:MAG: threonylcarbamoyl-AMP synthase [Burkholderiaceae bacterium]|nr:MAG: threonylcarbamoyl-AMP synthase [Burkholderiaceae bacterium]